MSILEAIVLGIVQGLTEFLPVSSTAHLRVVPAFFGWNDPGAAYSAVIQTGTLVAVCLARARRRGTAGRDGLERITATDGIAMGLAQAFALIPGTSRSGVTISAGMLAGLDRQTAARFSFLLSLPAVAAAALLEAWQQRSEILGSGPQAVALAVGTITAGIVGYAAVRWLLSMLTGHTLWPFIVYRLGLAALLAGSLAAGWLTSPAI